jgi:hypothetical protein
VIARGYDIFIAGGVYHFARLRALLPLLASHGRVHLASIRLNSREIEELRPFCWRIHSPDHDPDGYRNFCLYCTRDLNRLASSDYFIKIDADVELGDNWIEYVDDQIRLNPQVVLFGPIQGRPMNLYLTGERVKRELGFEIRMTDMTKVAGPFYVAKTSFFHRYDAEMQTIHRLLYDSSDAPDLEASGSVDCLRTIASEDTLRSMMVHLFGGPELIAAPEARGLIMPLYSPPRIPAPRSSRSLP